MRDLCRLSSVFVAACVALVVPGTAQADEAKATPEQAVAMVKKTVQAIKSQGKDPVYAEITAKSPQYIDRDLYVVVYDLEGVVKAHGANDRMVGKNLIELKDVDGKPFVKERVDLAKSKGTFWQDYKFTNPTTKKVEPKRMYCERLNDTAVCGGVYKPA
ncbi:histidine kinase [Roseateles sp. DAIF2]|uniref:cache domain-containing protein n=1 Tax=Roseateles sp. DAIF2 TaxID=2714952 RepID=UPI0018A32B59|nr:cache domain-containing protein [Roseateles sp. DAIF2]QPF74770.1 histidine kinase [Roseateles sp. DAIF2]